MRCGTTHKLLDYESIAMTMEKMQDNALFKIKKMNGLQVKCNGCGRRCVKRQNLKNHKFLMMSQLQWYGKRCGTTHNLKSHKLSDDESIAMNGKRCRATHNLKIHKWLDDNLNAMNVEWIAGQGTI